VTHGLRAAPHVRAEADSALLRHAALALLARPADSSLHGGALALLVRDPSSRARHLPQTLRHLAAGDRQIPPSAIVAAFTTHPEPVLDACRAGLRGPDAEEALRTLADATTPSLARRVAEAVAHVPHLAAHVAAYAGRRLDQGPAARATLRPLVTGLLDGGPEPVRAALAAPGSPASRPLGRELREHLRAHEHDPAVLDALLHAAVRTSGEDLRGLVHRTGLLLVRTTDGAARLDRGPVDLGRHVPGFVARVAGRLTDAPEEWVAVVGSSTRRTIETLAGVRVPARQPQPRTCAGSQPPCRCGPEAGGMAPLDLRKRQSRTPVRRALDKEQAQCSAGVAWRTSPRTGGAASSPSAPTTESTADTS
jgi:hypothetical protein